MGSQESKPETVVEEQQEDKEIELNDNTPSTPILTPLDPRSPSTNIARTPLELILGSKSGEENGNLVTKNVILGVDPRSPTVEFNRTPIIVSTTVKEPSKLQNKNFDNVYKSTIQTTPVTTTNKSRTIPPKLLGSTPITANLNVQKRRSLVGLLETNMDFTETDLDKVSQAKNELNKSLPLEDLHIDPDEPPEKETEENPENELKAECAEEVNNLLEEKTINITAHVKDFDKKLSNLIYQDETEENNKVGLKLGKIKENNRTPLSVRNSNEEPKKVNNKLKVSDKPRKPDNSRIPIFKDTYGKKIAVQCENTPPRKNEEKKINTKISQWDADKTLII